MSVSSSPEQDKDTLELRALLDVIQARKVPSGYVLALRLPTKDVPVAISRDEVSVLSGSVVVSGLNLYKVPYLQVFGSREDFLRSLTLARRQKDD